MIFFCTACFRPSKTLTGTFGREGANCIWCKATSRDRAMLLNIHLAFLSQFVKNPRSAPRILGVSDGLLMEKTLKKIYKSRYKNYHYHQEPRLDISRVPLDLLGSADIISCTEVLEHVSPPIRNAFLGLRSILKSKGVLVLSVPHTDHTGTHVEHFPIMKESQLLLDGSPRLIGTLEDGEKLEFTDLIFHGGVGSTLEYRVFSFNSLRQHLLDAGFPHIKQNRNWKLLGIVWENWSRVWICR